MLVMAENIGEHEADETKHKILRAWPREARGHQWAGRQFWLLDEVGTGGQHTLNGHARTRKSEDPSSPAWALSSRPGGQFLKCGRWQADGAGTNLPTKSARKTQGI